MNTTHEVTDARNKRVAIPENPQRIVSLICSITETLFELGLGSRIAGRTNYCIRPAPQVEQVHKIGGPKNPDLNDIISLNPDLVIANIEENEEKDIQIMEKEGLPVFVTYPRTVMESLELIRTLGLITGQENEAEIWYRKAEKVVRDVAKEVSAIERSPSILYLIWRKPYMAVNRDTYIHDLIDFCGGTNCNADDSDRYPVLSVDDMIRLQPEMILLPSEPYPFKEKHVDELMRYTEIPAIRNKKVLLVDGELFSWYGVRMIPGLAYGQKIIHSFG